MASPIDQQIGEIFTALEIRPDWRMELERRALALRPIDSDTLHERRRRVARAYADGAFSETEYEERLAAIDREIALVSATKQPDIDLLRRLLADFPSLWELATDDERRELVRPLIERVYVDVESRRICGIVPTAPFHPLLESGVRAAPGAPIELLSHDQLDGKVLDLVETGEN